MDLVINSLKIAQAFNLYETVQFANPHSPEPS